MTRAQILAYLLPSTSDVEEGFTELHRFARAQRGVVEIRDGRPVIVTPARFRNIASNGGA